MNKENTKSRKAHFESSTTLFLLENQGCKWLSLLAMWQLYDYDDLLLKPFKLCKPFHHTNLLLITSLNYGGIHKLRQGGGRGHPNVNDTTVVLHKLI